MAFEYQSLWIYGIFHTLHVLISKLQTVSIKWRGLSLLSVDDGIGKRSCLNQVYVNQPWAEISGLLVMDTFSPLKIYVVL